MFKKTILYSLSILVLASGIAQAQLSNNPWVEENDQEDLEKVYKQRKRHRSAPADTLYYDEDSDTITIDRTHAYIQEDELEQYDKRSFLDKIKDKFSSNPQPQNEIIPASINNRNALREQSRQMMKEQETPKESSFGLKNIQNSLSLPQIPNINVNNMIKKFERASGIDLKEIGRQLR